MVVCSDTVETFRIAHEKEKKLRGSKKISVAIFGFPIQLCRIDSDANANANLWTIRWSLAKH
jgi:hypothetical protein